MVGSLNCCGAWSGYGLDTVSEDERRKLGEIMLQACQNQSLLDRNAWVALQTVNKNMILRTTFDSCMMLQCYVHSAAISHPNKVTRPKHHIVRKHHDAYASSIITSHLSQHTYLRKLQFDKTATGAKKKSMITRAPSSPSTPRRAEIVAQSPASARSQPHPHPDGTRHPFVEIPRRRTQI